MQKYIWPPRKIRSNKQQICLLDFVGFVLGKGKPENQEDTCLFVQNLEAGKNLKLLAGGIQASVNVSGESGLSDVFRRKKMQYRKCIIVMMQVFLLCHMTSSLLTFVKLGNSSKT